jgi:glycine C-acetyltransferase
VVASVLAALDLLDMESWRAKKLKENAKYLIDKLAENDIHVETDSAIVCVIVPEEVNIRKAGKKMHDMGIFVNTIEFPAVPKELQRFRISMMATHTKEDIDYLVECLMKVLGD